MLLVEAHPLGHTGPVTGSLYLYLIYIYIYIYYIYIQGVTGGTDQTSGGCSLC